MSGEGDNGRYGRSALSPCAAADAYFDGYLGAVRADPGDAEPFYDDLLAPPESFNPKETP